ncbi:MAG: ATP-binding protein [Planctomycetota bacterium]
MPLSPFLGRERELDVLEEFASSGNPELFVLYGRRRVGKTELLQQLCERHRSVYFLAAEVRDKDNLASFRQALGEGMADSLVDNLEFPDWSAALGYAAERAGDERLVLVLDEFPYLCEANKGLPSLIQKFWDLRGKRSSLMLVLCGSQVSFMEKEVLAERSPLFGRRTGQRRLEPLRPTEALGFFPSWSLRDRVLAFGILGGMPAYLRRFRDDRSLEDNVRREILRPEGYLFDEVQFLLRTELKSPTTYNSILAAIARGSERVGDVALSVGVDTTTANKYLHVLRELRLVERLVPLTDPDPLRSRRGTYCIADRFLHFHFRHIQPHLSRIEAGRGAKVWKEHVQPDLERIWDGATDAFLADHLQHEASELLDDEIVEVGPHGKSGVRVIGRTVEDRAVACLLETDGALGTPALDAELRALASVFPAGVSQLVYAWTGDPARPLEVRREG